MQKTVAVHSLLFHYTPTTIMVAGAIDGTVQQIQEVSHTTTSKDLIPCIDALLMSLHWSMDSINYIGCAQGPGAFTTLRSLIVTVNGLSFAAHIPLLGFNTLAMLAQSNMIPPFAAVYALTDAFCHNVHSSFISQDSATITTKTISYDAWLAELQEYHALFPKHVVLVVGSGLTPRNHQLILPHLSSVTYQALNTHAPLQFVSTVLQQRWIDQEDVSFQLLPFYGKICSQNT